MNGAPRWRLIVVGGHTRSIGKTQLVCDVIAAFPRAHWIAGKITQYGHGVCAQNGENCDCAPDEHVCAINWETNSDTGTDSARFLAAGARRSFWLRTKAGISRRRIAATSGGVAASERSGRSGTSAGNRGEQLLAAISQTSLYFAVVDPEKEDFKDSARAALDRADALVLRGSTDTLPGAGPSWLKLPARLLKEKPSVTQREGEPLPEPLHVLVQRALEGPSNISI